MVDRRPERQSLVAIPAVLLVAAGVAWAGSQGGPEVAGVSVFAICALLAFLINWMAYVPAQIFKTERYYDLTGSLTYLSLVAVALGLQAELGARSLLLAALVLIWAARLGSFLFTRIRNAGNDRRFDGIKTSPPRFFAAWTLQGLWVLLTLACALAAMLSGDSRPLGAWAFAGLAVWVVGFVIEAVADRQKSHFRADPGNEGRFICTGLWAWSRHPNYFGEITLWLGVALIAYPALQGWQHVTLVSPVFVYLLITQLSGIPPLEARADEKWGDDPDYRRYRETTPVLVPRPPAKA